MRDNDLLDKLNRIAKESEGEGKRTITLEIDKRSLAFIEAVGALIDQAANKEPRTLEEHCASLLQETAVVLAESFVHGITPMIGSLDPDPKAVN